MIVPKLPTNMVSKRGIMALVLSCIIVGAVYEIIALAFPSPRRYPITTGFREAWTLGVVGQPLRWAWLLLLCWGAFHLFAEKQAPWAAEIIALAGCLAVVLLVHRAFGL
jgi:hypothetical protein